MPHMPPHAVPAMPRAVPAGNTPWLAAWSASRALSPCAGILWPSPSRRCAGNSHRACNPTPCGLSSLCYRAAYCVSHPPHHTASHSLCSILQATPAPCRISPAALCRGVTYRRRWQRPRQRSLYRTANGPSASTHATGRGCTHALRATQCPFLSYGGPSSTQA